MILWISVQFVLALVTAYLRVCWVVPFIFALGVAAFFAIGVRFLMRERKSAQQGSRNDSKQK